MCELRCVLRGICRNRFINSLYTRPMIPREHVATGATGNGASCMTAVRVDTYNAELRDEEGFVGDRASGRAFRAILDDARDQASQGAPDPLGASDTKEIGKQTLDRILREGDAEAAGILIGTIEEFAQEFAFVLRRFLRLKDWLGTQRIAVGGGLRASRIGEVAIGRTAVILKTSGYAVHIKPIHGDPDQAGLVGCSYLAPDGVLTGHDGMLAVDIGGSNLRVGTVATKSATFEARVVSSELWKHADDEPDRDAAVAGVIRMVRAQIDCASRNGLNLSPFIGVGCPGLVQDNGTIEKGGQNLPGNWEHPGFNLPELLREAIPSIAGKPTVVRMHNDAVVQGLSETPFMRDVEHWGIMTVGTGLGNARFTNRSAASC